MAVRDIAHSFGVCTARYQPPKNPKNVSWHCFAKQPDRPQALLLPVSLMQCFSFRVTVHSCPYKQHTTCLLRLARRHPMDCCRTIQETCCRKHLGILLLLLLPPGLCLQHCPAPFPGGLHEPARQQRTQQNGWDHCC